MENVADNKENIILPKEYLLGKVDLYKTKCVVLVHLFYEDTIDEYLQYVKNIPEGIDIYFTYSNEKTKKEIRKKRIENVKNIQFIYKKNRGRDISALLVAARDILLSYDYICFVHDKKEKNMIRKNDTKKWIYSLWENMLSSKYYIQNIIYTFEKKDNIGILVPPHLISEKINQIYTNQWCNDYELTVKLSNELNLKCDIDKDKSPITLGTVFWARTIALKKLLNKKWKYEDFDEEPLADDGTISHAVERIFAFVAQDARYLTGWVMTDEFAAKYIDTMQDALKKAFKVLDENMGIKYVEETETYKAEQERLIKFINQNKRTYIYGAGGYGITCYKILKSADIKINGFIVTHLEKAIKTVNDLSVYQIDQLVLTEEDGIIVAVSEKYEKNILDYLEKIKKIKKGKITAYRKWKNL